MIPARIDENNQRFTGRPEPPSLTQVKDLDRRAVDFDRARHGCKGCEINLRDFRVRARKFGHERGLGKVSMRCEVHENGRTLPTEGKPTKPTDAIPVRATSNPKPPPPPPPPDGPMSSRLSLASFALSWPRW